VKRPVSSEATYPVVVEKNLPMRARDGVTLYADVYRPAAQGRFPVLVIRTPYDKSVDNALTEKDYFPPRGYVVVVQDTRGRYASEGDFYPFLREADDGYDTIEWGAQLPWSDGAVGMVGQSYMAVVHYQAVATRPPNLRAMCPVLVSTSSFEQSICRRRAFELVGGDFVHFMS
jgi:putative CocE/NonD family hydrolase